jgi:hypothetical protein
VFDPKPLTVRELITVYNNLRNDRVVTGLGVTTHRYMRELRMIKQELIDRNITSNIVMNYWNKL